MYNESGSKISGNMANFILSFQLTIREYCLHLCNCFERNKMEKKESHMEIYGDGELNDPWQK